MAKGSVYEGKSFDEAVKKGLDDLGLVRAEATITLVEEGKGGFLGLGARPYRVSIMRRPGGAVREPEERGERRVQSSRGRDDKRGGGGRGGRDRDRGPREGTPAREGQPARESQPAREAQPAAEREGRGGRDRDRKREGGRGPQSPQTAEAKPARLEGARSERGERGGRRGERTRDDRPREERAPREDRTPRPVPAEAVPAARGDDEDELMPLTGAAPVAGGDTEIGPDGQRRRRRRGRRGGRGRRRGGPEGESPLSEQPMGTDNGVALAEPEMDSEPMYARREAPVTTSAPVSVPVMAAPAPTPMPAAPEEAMVSRDDATPAASEPAPRERHQGRDRDRGHDRGRDRDRDSDRDHAREGSHEGPTMTTEELGQSAKSLTENLLKSMGFEATVTVVAEADRADVTVEVSQGDDLLTGQKGETRQAIQHLLNRFLNRGEGSRYHLQLEINDFWQRREDELAALARSMAESALSGNAEMVTEYLNSQERRIIHVTLREDTRVKTYALGTGMIKRVAIAPADFPERTGEEDAG